ncbi:MAG TPA: hypothetical protein VH022_14475 [Candidatus Acidoferrum sp.]|jgi:hypothetical protein|nr:hypothetical protein [Candidatus Acidoferrum sp.]
MSRVAIAVQTPAGPYITGAPAAGSLDITETAADTTNFEATPISGNELLFAHNTDVSAHTVTITSAPDERGRTQDISAYSVGAGKISCLNLVNGAKGWQQSDGKVYYQANDATVKFFVIKPY